jgi:8-oxo-dGTP diphosphatase
MDLHDKIIYESPGRWIKVIETPHKFYYCERKGIDSVAVFLIKKTAEGDYLALMKLQPLPIHNPPLQAKQRLFVCPITGSIEEKEAPELAAKREALEEGGYDIPSLEELGSYIVGTQTNEVCYLFVADVTDIPRSEPKGDGSYFESVSKEMWVALQDLHKYEYAACRIGQSLLENSTILGI